MTTAALTTTVLQVGLSLLAIGVSFAVGAALQRRQTYYWRREAITARLQAARLRDGSNVRVVLQGEDRLSPALREADFKAGGLRSGAAGARRA